MEVASKIAQGARRSKYTGSGQMQQCQKSQGSGNQGSGFPVSSEARAREAILSIIPGRGPGRPFRRLAQEDYSGRTRKAIQGGSGRFRA